MDNPSQLVNLYLETDFPDTTNSKDYWKMNKGCLSKLYSLLTKFPFASVSVERTFSTAGNVLTSKRNLLSPINVKMLMFVNRNFDIYEQTLSELSPIENLN